MSVRIDPGSPPAWTPPQAETIAHLRRDLAAHVEAGRRLGEVMARSAVPFDAKAGMAPFFDLMVRNGARALELLGPHADRAEAQLVGQVESLAKGGA